MGIIEKINLCTYVEWISQLILSMIKIEFRSRLDLIVMNTYSLDLILNP